MGTINSVSYAGNPKDYTAMFITNKVSYLIENLRDHVGCLVFVETGMQIPRDILAKHEFIFSDYPQREYAKFAIELQHQRDCFEQSRRYSISPEGFFLGENARVGKDAYIEPTAIIGHDVVIGDNAVISAGTVIKNAIIGDNFIACAGCKIGMPGFTMAKDDFGNNIRIPTLGKVEIGDHVEVGVNTNISCGSGGNTIIEDYVKLDALVHVGHDVHIHKNAEIPAGVILGGYSDIGENVFIGINSAVRNRKSIGSNAYIGMGTVVNKNVDEGIIAVGNPVRKLEKESR